MSQSNNEETNNNKINKALNAADDAVNKFENMVNAYQDTTDQLNQIIAQNNINNNNNNNNNKMVVDDDDDDEDEEYPPPQPRAQESKQEDIKQDDNDNDNDNDNDTNNDEDVGGFAAAKHYCRHIKSALVIPKDMNKFPKLNEFPSCDIADCENKENWICLKCHKVLCGRYGNQHMIEHYMKETNKKHCIAMGVGDLSFWCYECNDYLHHLSIKPVFDIYKIVHQIKFGEAIPKKLEKETDFMDYEENEEEEEEEEQEIVGRDPNMNPLTSSGANRGLGNVESGKDTVLKEDQTEYYDSDHVLLKKAKKVSQMILSSKYTVIHTGAGISTSANLPDYRGPNGVWTLKAKGKSINSKTLENIDDVSPTYCHMALVELIKKGLLHYVVTTNVDGLHRKSGIDNDKLAELHGSIYMEYCNKCGKEYYRDYNVQKMQHNIASIATVFTRFTGRICENNKCKGKLRDSIIAFGESLPGNELYNSSNNSSKANLNIVIGSSMRVNPACNLPLNGNKFILINLQKTPYDNDANIRVWAKCDKFIKMVMDQLNINVKPYNKNNKNNNNNNNNDEIKDDK